GLGVAGFGVAGLGVAGCGVAGIGVLFGSTISLACEASGGGTELFSISSRSAPVSGTSGSFDAVGVTSAVADSASAPPKLPPSSQVTGVAVGVLEFHLRLTKKTPTPMRCTTATLLR